MLSLTAGEGAPAISATGSPGSQLFAGYMTELL